MDKTLVIVLGDTRGHELTYDNFKKNVIDELDADLCLCLAVKPNYNYDNPYYKLSKFKFLYDEPEDFGDAFDYAYNTITQNMDKKTIEGSIHWREFLSFSNILFGGVIYNEKLIEGGGGIVLFLRWFLLQKMKENNLIDQYDRFIITRSDYIYQLPHPNVEYLDSGCIWVPDSEHCGGYTDRHAVLSKKNIEVYLNLFNNLVIKSNDYYNKMKILPDYWGIEKFIKMNLEQENMVDSVKEFPYVMYLVRSENGLTRFSKGTYSNQLGYYIKYLGEYNASSYYKDRYLQSGLKIDAFYKEVLNIGKKCIIITTINKPSKQVMSYTNKPGWDLIVIGDSKTEDILYKDLNCVYLGLEEQKSQFPTLFDKIPLNSYTRKMFGYLYAIKNKYDVIYDTDDDNKYIYDLDVFEDNIIEFFDKDICPGSCIHRSYCEYDIKKIIYKMMVHKATVYTFDKNNSLLYLKDKQSVIEHNTDRISGTKRGVKCSSTPGFVNIYKQFTDEKIWPRGIPPGHATVDIMPTLTDTIPDMKISVIQGLVDNDPDVDAYYRINVKNTPFVFEKDPGYDIIMNKYSVCPFNTQNTFWVDKSTFYAMYLPISVTFRYTDILRGFIALYQLWKNDKTIKFTIPTAVQDRNEHDLMKDYESEEPMYRTAEKVIELLNENKNATIQEIYYILFKNNIVEERELETLNEWTNLVNQYEK